MKQKKMGALTLSGFIIGPVLGSGIFILPPIVHSIAKEWAIVAWVVMILISFMVAFIFGFLSIQFPGDGGATNAIEHVFGTYVKRLAAFYLIIGVTFGAAAVLLTAGQYIEKLGGISSLSTGYILLPLCIALLLARVNLVGKIALVMSIVSAAVLFIGGAKSLIVSADNMVITSSFNVSDFSYALLILFWAVFGWEVIGNYSADVKDPKKTITKAILLSIVAISVVDLIVAAAVQWSDAGLPGGGDLTITGIMYPVFGEMSHLVMAGLALFLCCSTYFFVCRRHIQTGCLAGKGRRIAKTAGQAICQDVPYAAVLFIFVLNTLVLTGVQAGIFSLEKLVAFANSFLTMNALIGICAGIVLIPNRFIKASGMLLSVIIIGMLAFHSTAISLVIMILLAVYYVGKQLVSNKKAKAL